MNVIYDHRASRAAKNERPPFQVSFEFFPPKTVVMEERFAGLEDDPETHALVASAVAAEQVLELVDAGVTEFHFYTLNRSNLVLALARLLGVRPD